MIVRAELRHPRFWMLGGVGLIVLIAYICLMPGDDIPRVQISDKLVHLLMFLAPAFWFGSVMTRRHLVAVGIALLAYGSATELTQGWLGWGRQADWLDLGADAAGIALGLLLALTPLGRWPLWIESLRRRPAT